MSQKALYPLDFPIWTEKKDNLDLVEGAHVNMLQVELDAVQRALGKGISVTPDNNRAWYPQGGPGPSGGARYWAFTGQPTQKMEWPSLNDRLINIEKAALRDLDLSYVSLWGGAVITPDHNQLRPAGTGGMSVLMPKTDPQPAFAVLNGTTNPWDKNAIAGIWPNGEFRGTLLRLRGNTYNVVIDPDNGFTVGNVVIGPNDVKVGTNITLTKDGGQADHVAIRLVPPISSTGETIYLKAAAGGVRRVFHIQDPSNVTKFLLDTDGNLTVHTLKILKDTTDKSKLELDGVYLDKNGLVFTWNGGAYRPGGAVFNDGGSISGGGVVFKNNQRITPHGDSISISGRQTNIEGGLAVQGMRTYFYESTGTMFIYIPVPGAPAGAYEEPFRSESRSNRRSVHCHFVAPSTGAVEIHFSVEIRSYSRPIYCSYMVEDTATGAVILAPADSHGGINNGARPASEQSDVDQNRQANFIVLTGLVPGRTYRIRTMVRAADVGNTTDGRNNRWARAERARYLIRPVMTTYESGVMSG